MESTATNAGQMPLFQPNKLEQGFEAFHLENPQVYAMFKMFTWQVIKRGFKHYSADAIVHRIRWETNVTMRDEQFKVNNNYVSYYARLFERDHPEHAGFFRKRASQFD